MNDGFKQRLIGAVVIISVLLISWPLMFSDNNLPIVSRNSQIPPMPEFEAYQPVKPVAPSVRPVAAPSSVVDKPVTQTAITTNIVPAIQPDVAPKKPVKKPVAKPIIKPPVTKEKPVLSTASSDINGVPVAWVLQVASFTSAANADALKLDLQKRGYKAFVKVIKGSDGVVTRVYIGPKLTREALEKERSVIDKRYRVKSLVTRFKP
ncbi:SPOR domain-containing protein [bacterium]|nr:SPOR domain-containing protein [bacterium]